MLTGLSAPASPSLADFRHREFARLDRADVAYLDYTGSALHADSQRRAIDHLLGDEIFGNPHSPHAASEASTRAMECARRHTLQLLDAGDEYAVCFTANATGAIRLVAESFAFGPDAPLLLSTDNHNSVNGLREYARRQGAAVHQLALDQELRLRNAPQRLEMLARRGGLFAYPAQSNFSGVRHPLSLVAAAQRLGLRVLLDAAAYVPTSDLSLREHPADFVVLSYYKLFGLPTGLGALVARRDALAVLERPWFSGGAVDYVSVALDRYALRAGEYGFEDGTPHFLGTAALMPGFQLREEIGIERVNAHVEALTGRLLDGLLSMSHANGAPVAHVYGPCNLHMRGATVAFNVLTPEGGVVPFEDVEARANARRVFVRGGCFCNPGAAETAFGFDPETVRSALDQLASDFSVPKFRSLLGGSAVGAVRASMGIANVPADIDRLLAVLRTYRQ
jgi:selenocysteine lyase/cysteine desulfurase